MKLEQILEVLDKDSDYQVGMFLNDNFKKIEYIGEGPFTKTFKGCSDQSQSSSGQDFRVLRIIQKTSHLSDDQIQFLYETEKKVRSSNLKDFFVVSQQIFRIQSCMIQVKDYLNSDSKISLNNFMRSSRGDSRDKKEKLFFELDSPLKTDIILQLLDRVQEMNQLPHPIPNDPQQSQRMFHHANLKPENVFLVKGLTGRVEVKFSDPFPFQRAKEEQLERKQLANLIHTIVCGSGIGEVQGKIVMDPEVKGSSFSKIIKAVVVGMDLGKVAEQFLGELNWSQSDLAQAKAKPLNQILNQIRQQNIQAQIKEAA